MEYILVDVIGRLYDGSIVQFKQESIMTVYGIRAILG